MLRYLIRKIRRHESPIAAQMSATIARLRESERLARDKGYAEVADQILAVIQDLEQEYGPGRD